MQKRKFNTAETKSVQVFPLPPSDNCNVDLFVGFGFYTLSTEFQLSNGHSSQIHVS